MVSTPTIQVVETSVIVNNNSLIQDYVQPEDLTQPFEIMDSWVQTFHSFKVISVRYSVHKFIFDSEEIMLLFTYVGNK